MPGSIGAQITLRIAAPNIELLCSDMTGLAALLGDTTQASLRATVEGWTPLATNV